MLMGITEYARHRGCNLKTVQEAVQRGRITREEDGRIDAEKADRDWERNTNHANARYRKPGHRTRAAEAKAGIAAAVLEDPGRAGGNLSFNGARAIKEVYEAKLKKLEHDEKLGKLILRRDVEVAAFNRFRVLRDAMLNVPVRLASQLAAESDPASVHEILENEIRQTLEEFSGGKVG